MAKLKGWRYSIFIAAFVGSITTFMYFSAVRPMLDPEPYRQIRSTSATKSEPQESEPQKS